MLFPHRVESVWDRVDQAWVLVIMQLCVRWALRAIMKATIRCHFLSASPTCLYFHAKHQYNSITTANCIRGIITHLLSSFVRITLAILEGRVVEHAITHRPLVFCGPFNYLQNVLSRKTYSSRWICVCVLMKWWFDHDQFNDELNNKTMQLCNWTVVEHEINVVLNQAKPKQSCLNLLQIDQP